MNDQKKKYEQAVLAALTSGRVPEEGTITIIVFPRAALAIASLPYADMGSPVGAKIKNSATSKLTLRVD